MERHRQTISCRKSLLPLGYVLSLKFLVTHKRKANGPSFGMSRLVSVLVPLDSQRLLPTFLYGIFILLFPSRVIRK